MDSTLETLHSCMHSSISFNEVLKTSRALAEYVPFNLDVFGSWIFLNSSATSYRLCVTSGGKCLDLVLRGKKDD